MIELEGNPSVADWNLLLDTTPLSFEVAYYLLLDILPYYTNKTFQKHALAGPKWV